MIRGGAEAAAAALALQDVLGTLVQSAVPKSDAGCESESDPGAGPAVDACLGARLSQTGPRAAEKAKSFRVCGSEQRAPWGAAVQTSGRSDSRF